MSQPRDHYSRMCAGKQRYEDKRAVQTYLNHFHQTARGRHGRPNDLRAYPCPLCRGWHVTKRNV